MKVDIKETLFWILLIIALGLLLWNIFGKSPTEFVIIITIIFMTVLKIWSISDQQIRTDINIQYSFNKIKSKMNSLRNDILSIKENIDLIKNKLKVK